MTNYFTSAIKIGQKVRKKYCLGVKKFSLGVQKNPKLIQMLGIIGRNGIQFVKAVGRGSLIILIGSRLSRIGILSWQIFDQLVFTIRTLSIAIVDVDTTLLFC